MATAQKNPLEELVIFGNPAKSWSVYSWMPDKRLPDGRSHFRSAMVEAGSRAEARRKFLQIYPGEAGRNISVSPARTENASRFQQLEKELVRESRDRRYPLRSPGGLAAAIGRRKYGAKKFAEMAKRGRRAAHNDSELDEAEALYQQFHGRDPEEIVELQRSAAIRNTYTACGPLLAIGVFTPGLKLPTPAHWDEYPAIDFSAGVKENGDLKADGVMLSANPEGTQLYAIGGDQNLDDCLDDFDVDTSKDLIALCEAAYVVYFDEKPHTGFQGVEYMHEFDQPRPVIGYDRLKKEIFFVGGRYEVKGNWLEH